MQLLRPTHWTSSTNQEILATKNSKLQPETNCCVWCRWCSQLATLVSCGLFSQTWQNSSKDNNTPPENSWSTEHHWWSAPFINYTFPSFVPFYATQKCFSTQGALSIILLTDWSDTQNSVLMFKQHYSLLFITFLPPSAFLSVWFDLISEVFDFRKLYEEAQLVLCKQHIAAWLMKVNLAVKNSDCLNLLWEQVLWSLWMAYKADSVGKW